MTNPTQLLPTDLIAVEVPKDAIEIQVMRVNESYFLRYINGLLISFSHLDCEYELLGEVTADEIDTKLRYYLLNNHSLDDIDFRSLLQSNGYYWVNLIEKPKEPKSKTSGRMADYFRKNIKWQEAESKVIKGKLVILKKL